jgi:hypothetical protein
VKKRIIICCDGTWNEPESIKDEHKVPTNVLKMIRAVQPRDEELGIEQVAFYDQGVGTGTLGVLDRSIGGGTGYGISTNIRNCYNFLANNYVAGDDIYLFGFSRGAYTVRSLAGMVDAVGVLSKNDLGYVPEAYAYYHTPPGERADSSFHSLLQDLPRSFPKIRFIGVWDTVGALGIPTPVLSHVQQWAGKVWPQFKVGFHNCNLLDSVEYAYQALAIDEHRGPFAPSVWDKRGAQKDVQQVWFAGVHSNIGGGYLNHGLSDTAFMWLANRAMECGLAMNRDYLTLRVTPDPLGKLEDSYGTAYKLLEYARVEPCIRRIGRHLAVGEMIHASVVRRIQSALQPPYRPGNLLLAADGMLQTISDQGRTYVEVGGVRVPVCTEREHLRIQRDAAEASFACADQTGGNCQIIDFTAARGARLRVTAPLAVGTQLSLASPLTGTQQGTVVWCRDDEVGVRFVG